MSKRPYTERSPVQIGMELHHDLKVEAAKRGISIRELIEKLYKEAGRSSEKQKPKFDFRF